MKLINDDCFNILKDINNEIDLILTDPPYTISKDTGFMNVKKGVKRFAVSMDFGEWDKAIIDLDVLCKTFFNTLKKGGSAIIFYDIWKITILKEAMEKAGFRMIRLIIWEKTNPVPLNSKRTYLTNSREIAIYGVKGNNPTFNSEYDNGIYKYPIEHIKNRIHPTQKPLKLIEDLIIKHSNINDTILDPFMGSGTTGVASLNCDRNFIGIEKDQTYFKHAEERIKNYVENKKRIIFGIS
ncbi:site-specific DNA-methyltransferase [Brachyspira pilosicoli]|uniref:DNA-methyltransferase n=1 Tax=Brachyspira pilosicoli TaxID=52584 RepID=UPI001CA52179|nr:site-specific DNA-methyltransferase [Brachyspira pilosicoli]MBW5397742.1 site-specific DNA-methyltransferase [Brachyspira pilosicoli]